MWDFFAVHIIMIAKYTTGHRFHPFKQTLFAFGSDPFQIFVLSYKLKTVHLNIPGSVH